MADDYHIDEGEVLDFAGNGCYAGKLLHGEGDAAVFEDGVEKDPQAGGELDVETGVAEPCCAEAVLSRIGAGGTEGWFCYRESDGGW